MNLEGFDGKCVRIITVSGEAADGMNFINEQL